MSRSEAYEIIRARQKSGAYKRKAQSYQLYFWTCFDQLSWLSTGLFFNFAAIQETKDLLATDIMLKRNVDPFYLTKQKTVKLDHTLWGQACNLKLHLEYKAILSENAIEKGAVSPAIRDLYYWYSADILGVPLRLIVREKYNSRIKDAGTFWHMKTVVDSEDIDVNDLFSNLYTAVKLSFVAEDHWGTTTSLEPYVPWQRMDKSMYEGEYSPDRIEEGAK